MELALMNDDEHATLAATLALIDAEQQLQAHGTVLVSEGEERASDPWAQRATRDRKRQRKEIEQLRGEVAALEAHATQLHKYFSINSSAQGRQCHELLNSQVEETAGTNRWFTAAVAEFKRLQSAMQQNWELKAALDEERSVSAALINIFQLQLSKQTSVFNENWEEKITQAEDDVFTSSLSHILVQLVKIHKRTDQMLAQFSTRDTKSVFSTSHAELDPKRGPSHEFLTNTPVSCDYRQLEQFLWTQKAKPPVARSATEFGDCHQRHLSVGFSESIEGCIIDSVFTIRKFVESNRVVFALASQLTFSGSPLVIHEDVWVVMTDVASESPREARSSDDESASPQANSKTLLQTHHRIYIETQDPHMTQEMGQLQDFVMQFHIKKNEKVPATHAGCAGSRPQCSSLRRVPARNEPGLRRMRL